MNSSGREQSPFDKISTASAENERCGFVRGGNITVPPVPMGYLVHNEQAQSETGMYAFLRRMPALP